MSAFGCHNCVYVYGPGVPEEVDGQAEVDGGEEDQVRHQEEPVYVCGRCVEWDRIVSSIGGTIYPLWGHVGLNYPRPAVASHRPVLSNHFHAPEYVPALVQPRLDPAGGRAGDEHGKGLEHEEAGGGGGPDGVAPDAVDLGFGVWQMKV